MTDIIHLNELLDSVRESSLSLTQAASLGLAVLFFAIASRLLYNVYFHPLSAFKGPLYLAASNIPLAILQLRGYQHRVIAKAHADYGPIVRISPTTLSFTDPSAWNSIYGYRKGGRPALPQDRQFYNDMLLDKKTISLAGPEEVIAIRKAMNPAFSQKALMELEPMVQSHLQRLTSQLQKASSDEQGQVVRTVDLKKWITFFTFDINSDFAFGEDMGCVASGSYHEWVQLVISYFIAATILHQVHKFPPLDRLLALCIPKSVHEQRKKHDEASVNIVRRRMAKTIERPDFMHYFARQAEKEGLSTDVIEAHGSVIILAGSETSAVVLVGALYHILSNSKVYERLCHEIRSAFATVDDIKLLDVLSKLPYLDAVVNESMRLHPPAANGFNRVVPKGQEIVISDKTIPSGTVVIVNQYAINTSALNFRDSTSFIPERWLSSDDSTYSSDKKEAMQPFSVGPRNCPGKLFALNNIKLALTHLIWTFDMRLDPSVTDAWAADQKAYTAWVQPELPVWLTKRA